MSLPVYVSQAKDGSLRMQVWVQPGAKRDETAGEVDGRIKVRLRAQAQDNKANEALLAFLAGKLKLAKSALELVSGQTNRRKTLRIRPGETPDWNAIKEATDSGLKT